MAYNNKKVCLIKNKAKSGFTLIETIIAILILGISFATVFALQSNLMRSVFNAHAFVMRFSYIKNLFVTADKEKLYQKEQLQKKIEDPALILTYSNNNASNIKGLEKSKNIFIEKVKGNWSAIFSEEETFVSFRFNPEAKTENKSGAKSGGKI